MTECRQSQNLLDYVEDRLPAGHRVQLETHLAECAECGEWVAAYAQLRETFDSCEVASTQSHPGSADLARFALEPESLDQISARRFRRHIESCLECSEEISLVSDAVRDSRVADPTWKETGASFMPRRAGLFKGAVAASLFLVVALLGAHRFGRTPQDSALSGTAVARDQIVRASRAIMVENTQVRAGASLGVESGQVVSFGEGFVVDSGARLSVSITTETRNGS